MVNGDVVRVGGKLIRKPAQGDTQGQERFKQRVQKEQERIKQIKLKEARQKAARDLDKQFEKAQFSNVNQAISQLQKIKNSNPNVFKFMKVKPETFKKQQENRIQTINNRIENLKKDLQRSRKKESEAKDERREDREEARQAGIKAEIEQLEKFKPRLEKGEIIKTERIIDFADDVGDAKRRQEQAEARAKRQKREQQKKIAKQLKEGAGNIEKINFETGEVRVNGQKIKLKPSQVKDLKLSSVKRANTIKKIDNLAEKAKNQELSVQDFQEARELGVDSSDLLKISADSSRYNKILNEQQKKLNIKRPKLSEQELRENIADKLGVTLASKIKSDKLAEVSGLYSSESKEEERKKLENFIKASVPRNISTQKQLQSLQQAINKKRKWLIEASRNNIKPSEAKELISTVDKIKAKTGGKDFRNNVDKVTDRLLKTTPTDFKPAVKAISGLSKLPGSIIDSAIEFLAPIVDPVLTAQALTQINSATLSKQGRNLGSGLQRGSPTALADFFLLLAPLKIPKINKIKTPSLKKALNNYKSNTKLQLNRINNILKKKEFISTDSKIKLENLKNNFNRRLKDLNRKTLDTDLAQDIKKNPTKLKSLNDKKIAQELNKLFKDNNIDTTIKSIKSKKKPQFKADIDASKIQSFLNSFPDKKTLKESIKQARQLGFAVTREKLKKPIFDLNNNRLLEFQWKVKTKKKKQRVASGRKAKKQQKKPLTEVQIAQQVKKQRKEKGVKQVTQEQIADELSNLAKKSDTVPKKYSQKNRLLGSKKAQLFKNVYKEASNDVKQLRNKFRSNKQRQKRQLNNLRRGHKRKLDNVNKKAKVQRQNINDLKKSVNNRLKDLNKQKKTVARQKKALNEISTIDVRLAKILSQPIKEANKLEKVIENDIKVAQSKLQSIKDIQDQLPKKDYPQDIAREISNKLDIVLKFDRPNIPKINLKFDKRKFKEFIPKKIKNIKIRKKSPKKPIRIRKINFDAKKLRRSGTRNAYIINIKKGNSIIAKTEDKLPLNRATNLAREIVDGKIGNLPLSFTYSLRRVGKTDIVDVKNTILDNKFRPKKTKSPKIQEAVERKKFRKDTKAEKKASKKKTKTKKKKAQTKSKKSSKSKK